VATTTASLTLDHLSPQPAFHLQLEIHCSAAVESLSGCTSGIRKRAIGLRSAPSDHMFRVAGLREEAAVRLNKSQRVLKRSAPRLFRFEQGQFSVL
jgi:hypothetical protein